LNSTATSLFRKLEERLAMPDAGESRASLGELLTLEFREFGASGQVYGDVSAVLDALVSGTRPRWVFEEFRAERVAVNTVLVTYRSKSIPGPGWKPPALRSSLWVKREGRWQLLFHQGTRLATDATG
jgi:hypothetical protein